MASMPLTCSPVLSDMGLTSCIYILSTSNVTGLNWDMSYTRFLKFKGNHCKIAHQLKLITHWNYNIWVKQNIFLKSVLTVSSCFFKQIRLLGSYKWHIWLTLHFCWMALLFALQLALRTQPALDASNCCWHHRQCGLQKVEVAKTANTGREESFLSCLLCIPNIIWERSTCLAKPGSHSYVLASKEANKVNIWCF